MDRDHGHLDCVLGDLLSAAEWTGPPPGLAVDSRVPRAARALCTRRGASRLIRMHPSVLNDPPAVVRGTVAHELAHLQLRPQPWAGSAAAALLLSALAVLAPTTVGGAGSSPAAAAIGAASGILLATMTVWVGYQPRRRAELAADRLSNAWVGGDGAAATLRYLQAAERPFGQALATMGFAPHPTAAQRLRHLTTAQ